MKNVPVHLDFNPTHKPNQPRFHNIPIHYQKYVSKHLKFLRSQNIISDVDPKKSFDCVMNAVITRQERWIHSNEHRQRNPGMQRTQYHIQMPQEIRHELKKANFFKDMYMGHGYHQLQIDEKTKNKAIFQTHEGIHRIARLYFGPTSASGIFHNEVRKSLNSLSATTNIHDNLLDWGVDEEDHYKNLSECLKRCYYNGKTLKLSKSTFRMSKIKWVGEGRETIYIPWCNC